MKDQLARYIDLLFAGAPQATDVKQEILQNTLDRYNDLVEQGKSPQAAYQLAISGIGDINEILGCEHTQTASVPSVKNQRKDKALWKKVLQAIGICLYILCPIPLFVRGDEIGLCFLLVIVALATALMVISGGNEKNEPPKEERSTPKETELRKAVKAIIWTVGLCIYFALSFLLKAWYITWVIFPLTAAVQGLVIACMDLKEAGSHEK